MGINNIIEEFITASSQPVKKLEGLAILSYEVEAGFIVPLLEFVRSHKSLRFTILTDLFGADFPANKKRFEIVYNLLSLEYNQRLVFKVKLAAEETIPSVSMVFSSACWYEREIFDMFGVVFANAKDLRRILTDYGFVGHPLRKDFPVSGHLQVRYDDALERVIYEPVKLEQEFRNFDFVSPWKGTSNRVLPGDEKATK